MAAHPRPLSPHLQVYRQPLTAGAMSILHRITGAILAIGALFVVAWLLAVAGGSEAFARFGAVRRSTPPRPRCAICYRRTARWPSPSPAKRCGGFPISTR
jgi:succinate dehydrogenase cytochrome b556 subunit